MTHCCEKPVHRNYVTMNIGPLIQSDNLLLIIWIGDTWKQPTQENENKPKDTEKVVDGNDKAAAVLKMQRPRRTLMTWGWWCMKPISCSAQIWHHSALLAPATLASQSPMHAILFSITEPMNMFFRLCKYLLSPICSVHFYSFSSSFYTYYFPK